MRPSITPTAALSRPLGSCGEVEYRLFATRFGRLLGTLDALAYCNEGDGANRRTEEQEEREINLSSGACMGDRNRRSYCNWIGY